MNISDFELYKDILKDTAGLIITPDKSYMLDSRLTPISKKWNYTSLNAMTLALRGMPDPQLVRDVIEAMTPTETSFFREKTCFEALRDVVLPYFLKTRNKKRPVRIWCAGAASGQEPYSVAMLLKEMESQLSTLKFEIVGTDVSQEALERARRADYSQHEVQCGLPVRHLIKYFEKEGERWQIKDSLRGMVSFRPFNLLDEPKPLGTFDVILCCNVLSLFEDGTRKALLGRLSKTLAEDGFLLLGRAENSEGTDSFKAHEKHTALYVLQGGKYKFDLSGRTVA